MISLVKADISHARHVWLWRNDLDSRKMFRSQELVSWDDHQDWFGKSLLSPTRFLYVGIDDSMGPLGIVRFDFMVNVKEFCSVSINVSPAARGKGVGKQILVDGIQLLKKDAPSTRCVMAEIKSINFASLHLFRSLGFEYRESLGAGLDLYSLSLF
jgi:L-amino acid N-acyltransferase YncA